MMAWTVSMAQGWGEESQLSECSGHYGGRVQGWDRSRGQEGGGGRCLTGLQFESI